MTSEFINEIVEIIGDEFYEEINRKELRSRDEAMKITSDLISAIYEAITIELEDIADDYCEEKGLRWLDE